METKNEELTLGQKIKIVGTMTAVAVVAVVGVAVGVNYKAYAQAQSKVIATQQAKAVEAQMTRFPRYMETKEFKAVEEKKMLKVKPGETGTLTTSGSDIGDPTVPNNSYSLDGGSTWYSNGTTISGITYSWSSYTATFDEVGLPVAYTGLAVTVVLDSGVTAYGLKNISISSGNSSSGGAHVGITTGSFKIDPPCPTDLTVTHSP